MPEAGEFDVDRELIIPRISTVTSADDAQEIRAARYGRRRADVTRHSGARRELRSIGRERIGPILLLGIRSFNLRAPQGGHGSHPFGDQRKVTGRDLYKPESEGRPPARLAGDER